MSQEFAADEKLEIMEKEYDIPAEEEIREEVYEMCNLSQGIKEKTYAEIIYMMYKSGLPIEQIAGIIKMSTDKVQELLDSDLRSKTDEL